MKYHRRRGNDCTVMTDGSECCAFRPSPRSLISSRWCSERWRPWVSGTMSIAATSCSTLCADERDRHRVSISRKRMDEEAVVVIIAAMLSLVPALGPCLNTT